MMGTILGLLWALTSASAATECTVLAAKNGDATFYFPDRVVTNAVLVLKDGRIAEATESMEGIRFESKEGGSEVALWNGLSCTFEDVSNQVVTPGLVAVSTQLGVVEVGLEDSSRDDKAADVGPIRASFRVADGYNPRSTLIPVTRVHGITSATVHPTGGFVSGQVAWVDLAGQTQQEAVVQNDVALSGNMDWMRLAELLDEVRFFAKNRSGYDQNRVRSLGATKSQLAALLAVVQMEQPLILTVNRAADIEAAIRFHDAQRIRLILNGVAEGWLVADALAEAEIPVIVNPLLNAPRSFDAIAARGDNAALLNAAGVSLILSAESTHNARTLRQVAGNAVRDGLDHRQAMLAMTQTPAEVFGQKDRGRLEAGFVANVVVWTGDPLELDTAVRRLFIKGQSMSLDTRQKQLLERYRTLPGSPVPALTLPE